MFAADEYERRLAATRAGMAEAGLDALLLHQPENVLYLSGFFTVGYGEYHALLVPADGELALIARDVEVPAARDTSWVANIVTYADAEKYDHPHRNLRAAARAIQAAGVARGRIGIEPHSQYLTLGRYDLLRAAVPTAVFTHQHDIVDRIRLVKSLAEVEEIRRAARVAEAGMGALIGAIRDGVSERELGEILMYSVIRAGGNLDGHVITTGNRTDQIHGLFSDRVMRTGESAYLEVSAQVNHYIARIIRTAVAGSATPEQERTARVLIDAHDNGLAHMKAGASSSAVDRAFRQPVVDAGLRSEYLNRTGYDLSPRFRVPREHLCEFVPGSDWTLEAGMVFHVLVLAGGFGFSETVLVSHDGPELLTNFGRRLFQE